MKTEARHFHLKLKNPDAISRLEALANERGVPMTHIISVALEVYLEAWDGETGRGFLKTEQGRKDAKALLGN